MRRVSTIIQCAAFLHQFDGFSEIRYVCLFESGILQVFRIRVAGIVLTMHDENLLQPFVAFLAGEVADKLVIVAMTGEGIDAGEGGADLIFVAENGNPLVAAHNLRTQGGRGAVAHTQDGRLRVLDVVGQVMFDTPGLHHAGGGDDDARTVMLVQGFGIVNRAHVGEVVKAERILRLESVFEKKSKTNDIKLTAITGARIDTMGARNGFVINVRMPQTTPAKTPDANLEGIVVRSPRMNTATNTAPDERI